MASFTQIFVRSLALVRSGPRGASTLVGGGASGCTVFQTGVEAFACPCLRSCASARSNIGATVVLSTEPVESAEVAVRWVGPTRRGGSHSKPRLLHASKGKVTPSPPQGGAAASSGVVGSMRIHAAAEGVHAAAEGGSGRANSSREVMGSDDPEASARRAARRASAASKQAPRATKARATGGAGAAGGPRAAPRRNRGKVE